MELPEYKYSLYQSVTVTDDLRWEYTLNDIVPGDGVQTNYSKTDTYQVIANKADEYQFYARYICEPINGGVMFPSGKETEVQFDNLYYSYYIDFTQGSETYTGYERIPTSVRAMIQYADGTAEYIDEVEFYETLVPAEMSFKFTFKPTKDVAKVEMHCYLDMVSPFAAWNTYKVTCYFGEINPDGQGWKLSVNQVEDETGLLSGIIEWLKGIYTNLTDGLEKVRGAIANLSNSIFELPARIWSFIEEGLKGLFVPDEVFMADYMDLMDGLLEEKFGAVYQVIDITLESWDSIQASDEQNTINFPETSIDLPDNNEFSFGGYEVAIVPEGFEWLATALKGFVGVVCTVLFVNGLRKRYDDVMGV